MRVILVLVFSWSVAAAETIERDPAPAQRWVAKALRDDATPVDASVQSKQRACAGLTKVRAGDKSAQHRLQGCLRVLVHAVKALNWETTYESDDDTLPEWKADVLAPKHGDTIVVGASGNDVSIVDVRIATDQHGVVRRVWIEEAAIER